MKLFVDIKTKTTEILIKLNSEQRIFRVARYLVAGGTGAFVNLGTLFVLVHFGEFYYLTGSVVSFLVAFSVSFILQKLWTFRDFEKNNALVGKQLYRYLLIALFNLFLNVLFMYFFVDIFGFWYMLAQFVSAGLIAILSYYLYKFFVFGNTKNL